MEGCLIRGGRNMYAMEAEGVRGKLEWAHRQRLNSSGTLQPLKGSMAFNSDAPSWGHTSQWEAGDTRASGRHF